MNEANFWELMEHTKQISRNNGRKQAQLLIDELTKLTKDEIIDYYKFFRDYMGQAYSHNLWDAAYIIGCGCSDDGFKDFRAWLIGQGRTAFENALKDPESLIEVVRLPYRTQVEDLLYVPDKAYLIKTGDSLPPIPGTRPILKGEGTEESDLQYKYPRLYAKFGDCAEFTLDPAEEE